MTSTPHIAYSIEELACLPSPVILEQRRAKIQAALSPGQAAVITAGLPQARNFPANHYPDFRASSHFLYLVGQHLPMAILLVTHNAATLYHPPPTRSGALWHGVEKSLREISAEIGCEVTPLNQLQSIF